MPYTLHPTPCTLHLTLYTLHPTPCTLHPTLYTLDLTPYTLHHTRLQQMCATAAKGHATEQIEYSFRNAEGKNAIMLLSAGSRRHHVTNKV